MALGTSLVRCAFGARLLGASQNFGAAASPVRVAELPTRMDGREIAKSSLMLPREQSPSVSSEEKLALHVAVRVGPCAQHLELLDGDSLSKR